MATRQERARASAAAKRPLVQPGREGYKDGFQSPQPALELLFIVTVWSPAWSSNLHHLPTRVLYIDCNLFGAGTILLLCLYNGGLVHDNTNNDGWEGVPSIRDTPPCPLHQSQGGAGMAALHQLRTSLYWSGRNKLVLGHLCACRGIETALMQPKICLGRNMYVIFHLPKPLPHLWTRFWNKGFNWPQKCVIQNYVSNTFWDQSWSADCLQAVSCAYPASQVWALLIGLDLTHGNISCNLFPWLDECNSLSQVPSVETTHLKFAFCSHPLLCVWNPQPPGAFLPVTNSPDYLTRVNTQGSRVWSKQIQSLIGVMIHLHFCEAYTQF